MVDFEGKGRGVVSTRPFKKGELICEYSGRLISHEEAKKKEEEYSKDSDIGCYMYYFTHKTNRFWYIGQKEVLFYLSIRLDLSNSILYFLILAVLMLPRTMDEWGDY